MSEWVTEGCAQRSATRIRPVVHLIIRSSSNRMWCSGGAGIAQTTLHVPGVPPNHCPDCRKLAQEAVDEETLSAADLPGWGLVQHSQDGPGECWATGRGQREVHDLRACEHYLPTAPAHKEADR